ncbi:MAG: hypothetical protein ACE366_17225 [Bradymonadia bacterium]
MAFVRQDTGERLEQGESGLGVAIRVAQLLERPEEDLIALIVGEESQMPHGGHHLEIWQIDELLTHMQSVWHALAPLIDEHWRLTPAALDFVTRAPELVHETPEGPSLANALAHFHGAVMFLREAQAADQPIDFG